MTVCVGRDGVFGGGVLSKRPSPSSRTVTVNDFAGAGGFFKAPPASSADSAGSQIVCHRHTLIPRRAQNPLAGRIFVGGADKSAFALLSRK